LPYQLGDGTEFPEGMARRTTPSQVDSRSSLALALGILALIRRDHSTLKLGQRGSGPHRPWLLIIVDGVSATHPLPERGTVVIGRAADSDIRIDHPSISRRHARLEMGPPMTVEDLGSANGTRLRQALLDPHQPAPLGLTEVIEVGSAMAVVQRHAEAPQQRRMLPHDYFETRLEEECARAAEEDGVFTVVRVHLSRAHAVEELLAGALRPLDVAGEYGPRDYELLLADADAAEAGEVAERLRSQLEKRGVGATVRLACFPADGLSADALLAHAAGSDDVPPADPPASGPMTELLRVIERAARSDLTVLILGETGVGKEVMAERVHKLSPRRDKPLLRLNTAALSETLLESELFGHEKGAFTGAFKAKPGLLETAAGGTVFLDEIGDLPERLQVKLLRVLEERVVWRVGALSARPIDVRFVAATHRDLEARVAKGEFRQDLYFRISAVSVVIPPLRERRAEIPALAQSFIAHVAARLELPRAPRLTPPALEALCRYSWPGNIRELRNVVERAVCLTTGNELDLAHLPLEKLHKSAAEAPPGDERSRILQALAECAGNQTQAAKKLGISRGTLVARLESFGIARPRKGK
jgi:two-component system, NtrC family, response regulator AtoC